MAYKVLIIGCGAIAGGYDAERSPDDWPLSHAGAIARDERFELVACVDPVIGTRKRFAERWNASVAEASLEGLSAKPGDFDLIVIASPTQHHAEHLEWALTMEPRAVFCEKPLAENAQSARKLALDYQTAKTPLAVNFTRRWAPDLNRLVEEIENEDWGELIGAVGTYTKGAVHNGSHMVDLMEMFVGPVRLHSAGPALLDCWDDDPSVSAILTANDMGQPLHLVSGDAQAVTQFELVLNYDLGEIAMRDGGMRIEIRRVEENPHFKGYRQLGAPESIPGRYSEAMTLAYENLAKVIARKAYPKVSGSSAAETQAICEEIRAAGLQYLRKYQE
ncbi:Gfo/Idh/MocA family protein [Erythrobacter sp. JK5]|uniref:Gfo/Idh/MocA family protein n=1 Tax=Erythrobacter sp. JK5 TaxID=2829500 RepID=UPI001BA534DD|nr:Gfo/Idh/MocA family oxidoreductase [Erythrobacter sp. JK5]QUL37347.1 Gfo/Idh/MocA family oxidoreductase [Erythrobacter sp. JK5]